MTDSTDVLNMLKIVYTIYTISVMLLIAWFAFGVMSPKGKPRIVKPSVFYGYVGVLVTIGVAIHIVTFNKIPWVEIDFKRDHITPDKVVNIVVKDHHFELPEKRIIAQCQEYVLFDVDSKDLTYGFGLFRQNNSMVLQMQVVPGSSNQLMWKFEKNGVYSIRSTEYSGPKGAYIYYENAFEVQGCETNDKYAMRKVQHERS